MEGFYFFIFSFLTEYFCVFSSEERVCLVKVINIRERLVRGLENPKQIADISGLNKSSANSGQDEDVCSMCGYLFREKSLRNLRYEQVKAACY